MTVREPNPYYDPNRQAGEEVSSTGEGRHILVLEENLMHPTHADGLVDKGDPVVFYDGVGTALKSATSSSEFVPIDTEGIWRHSVTAVLSVSVGETLYITSAGIITDDVTAAWAVFGYALQPIVVVDGPDTEVIAVKVHWMWPFWWYFMDGV